MGTKGAVIITETSYLPNNNPSKSSKIEDEEKFYDLIDWTLVFYYSRFQIINIYIKYEIPLEKLKSFFILIKHEPSACNIKVMIFNNRIRQLNKIL